MKTTCIQGSCLGFIQEDSTGDAVARVARLQHFDGHFEMISQLLKIIEVEQSELPALSAMVALGDKTDEFATLLALRFLETIKDERSEAAEGLKEKAREYLEGQLGPTKYAQVLSAVQTQVP